MCKQALVSISACALLLEVLAHLVLLSADHHLLHLQWLSLALLLQLSLLILMNSLIRTFIGKSNFGVFGLLVELVLLLSRLLPLLVQVLLNIFLESF
mmetsp:Transcript_5222/g.4807  ORF Transcript_5222/g.4807 Transcript_5222/m.4807 type:complete len:97 (+) Transcript_5222:723-1013(+)